MVPAQTWSNINATPPRFSLGGGRYVFMGVGTFGTATLQALAPDGTTLLTVTGAALSANGYVNFEVAGGTYQLTLAGTTGFYGTINQIPLSPAN
jgi:hypothetical protein